MKTVYIVQGFSRQRTKLIADTALPCRSEHETLNRAERLADKRAGVIAIAQEYDEDSGEYGQLMMLAHYGDTPVGGDRGRVGDKKATGKVTLILSYKSSGITTVLMTRIPCQ